MGGGRLRLGARQRFEDIEAYAETLQAPSERHRDLLVRVMKLPEKYRVPMVLHYYIGLSTDEVARAIKVPAATVRTRLARGRAFRSCGWRPAHFPGA